jgi:GTP cyclohydrolase I
MNARDPTFLPQGLPDIQASPDVRNIAIQRVGVKSIKHPMMVMTAKGPQATVASIDMTVGLPADQKGTHMSRFLEVLNDYREPISTASLGALMRAMLERLEASSGSIEMRFPYFVMKAAPVSGVESLMDYQVRVKVEHSDGATCITQEVGVPVTSLCPCSKQISDYGAHNQRSQVTIAAELAGDMTVEEQICIAEQAASCELWGLLKRPDEKYVTERAYDNPKFVEDMVRDIAVQLDRDARVLAYRVASENFESIHNHSAYAELEKSKRAKY